MSHKRTVLVTGASSGLGHAASRLFHEEGWNVIATMRKPLAIAGCHVVEMDVTDPRSVEAAVTDGLRTFGCIDAVLNNAGYGLFSIFEGASDAQIRALFEVNVFGVMNVTRAVLPHFRERRSGVFVNVSSGAGVFVLPTASLYSASKFALEAFSEGLSHELATFGVRVKIIEPGGFATSFNERATQEAKQVSTVEGYEPFVAKAGAFFAKLAADRDGDTSATADKVARVAFDAANDTSPRLRYVATDAIKGLVELRRAAGEERYMNHVRAMLG